MIKHELTPHQKAMHELRREMIASRDMSPAAAQRFVDSILHPGQMMNAEALPIKKVSDAVSYLALMRIAAQSNLRLNQERNPLLNKLAFDAMIDPSEKAVATTEMFITPNFKIIRRITNAT